MRISDWSSDVCSSDLSAVSTGREGSIQQSAGATERPCASARTQRLVLTIRTQDGAGVRKVQSEMRRIYRYGLLWAIGFPKPCGLVKQVRSPLPAPAVKTIRGHVPAERDAIGREHVCTQVTTAPLVCRLLHEKKKQTTE